MSDIQPLVSVIIPSWNAGAFIGETISSALAQTYRNLEIIVVDDGSTDDTAGIVKKFTDPRLIYHYQQNSGRPAHARNTGVKLSKGRYIAFLDSDDLWMPQKIEKQMAIIQKNKDVALVSTNAYLLRGSEKTLHPMVHGLKDGYFNCTKLSPEDKVVNSSALVNKEILNHLGGLNENADLKAIEDYDLWLRLASKYPCYFVNEHLVYCRIGHVSVTGSSKNCLDRELNHLYKYFPTYHLPPKMAKDRLSLLMLQLAFYQLDVGEKEWRKSLRNSVYARPSAFGIIRYIYSFLPRKVAIPMHNFKKSLDKNSNLRPLV